MPTKILWLTIWTTLAYWLGNIGGCAAPPSWPVDDPVTVKATAQLPEEDREPSVTSLDRSDWQGPVISPAPGTVYHYPTYFRDLDIPHEIARSDREGYGVEAESQWDQHVLEALHAGHASTLDPANYTHPPMQAVKFGVDFVKMPALMVVRPPWEVRESP